MIVLLIIWLFLFRVKYGVYMLYAIGTSILYLGKIKFDTITGLDIAGLSITVLLLYGMLLSKKNIVYEIRKEGLFKFNIYLLVPLFLSGVLLTGFLYPSHTYSNFISRTGSWVKLLNCCLFLIIVSAFFNNRQSINKLINIMLISLIIPGFIFVWQLSVGELVANVRTGYNVPDALFHHPAVYAYALVYHFPLIVFKFFQSQKFKQKFFWIIVGSVILSLIYFTYRRGVWLGLLVQLIVYFVFLKQSRIKIICGYFLLIVTFILLFFTELPVTISDRFNDIALFFHNFTEAFSTHNYDDLFSGRWAFFRANLLYIFKQPILNLFIGNGIGATHYASEQMGVTGGDHNTYLMLIIDYGLINFIAFMIFLFCVIYQLFKISSSEDPFLQEFSIMLLSLFSSYLVMGMVIHTLYAQSTNWLLWGLIGAILSCRYRKDEKEKKHQKVQVRLPSGIPDFEKG